MISLRDIVLKNKKLEHDYKSKFQEVFGITLSNFMDPITGFKIVEFDQYIKTPDGISTRDYLLRNSGEETVKLIEILIGKV